MILVLGLKVGGSCWRVTHWRVIWTDLHSKDHFGCCVDGLCQMLSQDRESWEILVCLQYFPSPWDSPTHMLKPAAAWVLYLQAGLSRCTLTSSVPLPRHRNSCHLASLSHSFSLLVSWCSGLNCDPQKYMFTSQSPEPVNVKKKEKKKEKGLHECN